MKQTTVILSVKGACECAWKDLMPSMTECGLNGDEMLRFAQHDKETLRMSVCGACECAWKDLMPSMTECGLNGDEMLRFAQHDKEALRVIDAAGLVPR